MRTVGYDPGLLSREELLAAHTGTRRRTLEELITNEKFNRQSGAVILLERAVMALRWFVDNAQIRISVRDGKRESLLRFHFIHRILFQSRILIVR
jgi:hypothetical protein